MTRLSRGNQTARRIAAPVVRFATSHRGSMAVGGIIGFVIAVARPVTGNFYYDAMVYWSSSVELVTGGDFFEVGGLVLRGALSTLVYVPAASATAALGPLSANYTVLVQNAILIGVLGAVILPALARLFVAVRPGFVYVSSVLTAVLLGGFAPYPLVDLWAVTLVLVAILIVGRSDRLVPFLVGGALLGASVNVRPAYLVPVLLILLSWGIFYRLRALWALAGAAVAFVPQVVVNLIFAGSAAPWPVNTFAISDVQTKYAGYVVRYDTLVYVPDVKSQLFYCSPPMADRFIDGTPDGAVGLAVAYLQHLPGSLKFVAQKVSASMNWTTATPYSDLPDSEPSALTALVVAVSVVGIVGLIWLLVRRVVPGVLRFAAPVLGLWAGTVATIGFATPEARFAVPLVVVGVIGALVVAGALGDRVHVTWRSFAWAGGCVVLAAAIVWLGVSGLAHPGLPGDVTPGLCVLR